MDVDDALSINYLDVVVPVYFGGMHAIYGGDAFNKFVSKILW